MIVEISWEKIKPIWANELWPNRPIHDIEPTSTMLFLSGKNICNQTFIPKFFGYVIGSTIVGVNSGHSCIDNSFRSRGLYVKQQFRGLGIGIKLLNKTIELAKNNNSTFIWSLPRQTSWKTYKAANFLLASNWFTTETSNANAYCFHALGK